MEATEPIQQFYQAAVELLSSPASSEVPETTLYHPAAPPTLLIHIGPAGELSELRRQLPDHSFLLGLHPAEEAAASPKGQDRTLTHPIEDIDECVRRVVLLTDLITVKQFIIKVSDGFRERYPDEVLRIHTALDIAYENAGNNKQRGMIRMRSACGNLRQMQDGPLVKPNRVDAAVPVILCGAGPSLARHLAALKSLQGRAVIAAVGHAVQTLDKGGIVPDIIFESDLMAGINWPDHLQPASVLVASQEVSSEVARRFKHICWTQGSSMPNNLLAEKYNAPLSEITSGKTISVQSIDFLKRMGFRHMALLGQDYCFDDRGRMYAETEEVSNTSALDENIKLPAASGTGEVSTDRGLKGLLESVNHYLETFCKTDDLTLINVSGGARIGSTVAMSIEEWAQSLPSVELPELFDISEGGYNEQMLSGTVAELKRGLRDIDGILKSCRSLTNELDRHPIRMDPVKKWQKAMEQAIENEAQQRSQSACCDVLHTIYYHADEIMKETPGMISENVQQPLVQLNYLSRRYGLVKRFYEDVLDSLETGEDPLSFSAFKYENRMALKNCNPEFSERVMELSGAADPDFKIRWFSQLVPYVQRNQNGQWIELSGFSSIFEEAASVVDSFIRETGFDPCRNALTVVAPGNWIYVLEFLRRYPKLELAVIEPWPELLAQMISRGCFLHRLPDSALVVEHWANPAFMKRIAHWNKLGMKRKVFVSPHVETMPDVETLVRNMEVLP